MNVLSIENVKKSYGERILFEKVTFGLDQGDKIGLIGINGTGKSTFLKVLAGKEPADEGKITVGTGIRVGYLPQNPEFDDGCTVLAQVFTGSSPVMQIIREYEQALEEVELYPGDVERQKRLISLTQKMDAQNAWQIESEAKAILTKLGIRDFSANVGALSGGQRKRVALASVLVNPSELLILDEPTNHIDNEMVGWLEQYLQAYTGALVMITHDRYFLDRVATGILEISKGKLYTYTGNYSKFLEISAAREEQEESSERKRLSLLRNELAWIRRGARARTTKQKARIDRFEQLCAQGTERRGGKLDMEIGSTRLGRKVIELEHIQKVFGDKTVIRDFSYIVLRDERAGIVGSNGSGKSTLLNIIAGRLCADSGTVEVGQTVKIGCFSQENGDMDESMRVIDYVKEEAHVISAADGRTLSASQMLERFLFPPNIQWTPIAKLSGGEKRRLYLLRILMSAPNVLLLDEPTNDLDIQTLTILEDYLENFPGAVIAVSHDRYFLDRLADKIFAFEGNGVIRQYTGGYSNYLEQRAPSESTEVLKAQGIENREQKLQEEHKKRCRFSFNEQREYDQIEGIIAGTEAKLQETLAQIDNAGSDFELLQKLTVEQRELESELDRLLERWAYLSEMAEKMEKH